MISEREYGEFLDLAYGAALEPGSWTQVIERFADLMGGAKAWMPSLKLRDGSGDGLLARIDPREQDAYFEYYATVNPFFLAETVPVNDPWPLTITTDEDIFLKEEFLRTEYYNDFLKPQQIHSTAIVRLTRRDGVETTLNLGRPEHRGRFEPEDLRIGALLQPHVVRSLTLTRSLAAQGQFAGSLVEVLDRAAHGLFLLVASGQLRHANREAERLLAQRDGLRVAAGRLSAAAGDSGARLEALIHRAGGREAHARSGGSMLMTTPLGGVSLSLTVAPLSSERAPAPFGPWVLVCVTDLTANVKLPEQSMRDLFGLTAAEARVALALFEGASPRQAADSLGVTIEGLSATSSHPVQKAWAELDVPQCGYCQSGQIMAAAALLGKNPKPTDKDIDEAMTNICRCGTYQRIRAAVHVAAGTAKGGGSIIHMAADTAEADDLAAHADHATKA